MAFHYGTLINHFSTSLKNESTLYVSINICLDIYGNDFCCLYYIFSITFENKENENLILQIKFLQKYNLQIK